MRVYLRDLFNEEEYEGACACFRGRVNDIEVKGCCWRTGPQPSGVSVQLGTDSEKGLATGLLIASAINEGWPGMRPITLYFSDGPIAIVDTEGV